MNQRTNSKPVGAVVVRLLSSQTAPAHHAEPRCAEKGVVRPLSDYPTTLPCRTLRNGRGTPPDGASTSVVAITSRSEFGKETNAAARRAGQLGAARGTAPPGAPLPIDVSPFLLRPKHRDVTSSMASPTSVFSSPRARSEKSFVDKLWVSPVSRSPIPFVKEPVFATDRTNSPGDRVATGCKPVASWAKLVRGKGGHR